jgi:hypothetical protein
VAAPATLGQATPIVGTGNSISHTTTSGPITAKLWSFVGWNDSAGATSVSSLTYGGSGTGVTLVGTVTNGSNHESIYHVDIAGLANASTVAVTFSSTNAQSKYLQTAFSTDYAGNHILTTSGTTGTTAWTSGSITVNSGEVGIGADYGGSTSATNTASGGNTEIHDQNLSTDSSTTTCYQLGTGASIAASGTWTASQTNGAIIASFGSGAAAVSPASHPRRMPLGA